MKNRFIQFLTYVLMALPFAASAQEEDHPLDKAIAECYNLRPTPLGIIECEIDGYKAWVAEMEKVYASLLEKLDDASRQALTEQQSMWLQYRDKTFGFNDKFYGTRGTAYISMLASNKTEIVRLRALELLAVVETLERNQK